MRLNMLGIGLRKNEPALKARLDGWVRDNLQNGKLNAVYKEFHGVNLPPEVQGPAAERPEATMARIASVDIFLVDLLPGRAHRRGAELRAAGNAHRAHHRQRWRGRGGLQLHHRHRRLGRGAPAGRAPGADAAGPRGRRCGGVVARADVPGARHHGGRADLDRAGRHRHGAVGPACRAGLPLHRLAGGAKDRIPLYTTEGGWLHLPTEALVEARCARGRLSWRQAQVGRPHVAEDVARIAAVREAVGDDWDIMVDANQGFRCPRRSAARAPSSLWTLPGWKSRSTPTTCTRTGGCRPPTTVPIAVGESLYSLSQFATICRATPARWCRWTWVASAASRRG